MKTFILVDENNIIRCMASEECNLHDDKLYMDKYLTTLQGTVGDEYDPDTDTWTPRPENYPQPSADELNRQKIDAEIRDLAVKSLIDKGELPPDYKDIKVG